MASLLQSLKVLGDESRLRLLRVLAREELSVAELQEIFGMAQSRISMALSQLKQAELVELRKVGQKRLYRFQGDKTISDLIENVSAEIPDVRADDRGLALVLEKRKDHMRAYFDSLAGRFGRDYVPGRSWKALSETLMKLLPPMRIADIGAGEATLSLLLAQRAKRVFAIDNSPNMIAYAREAAQRAGVENIEFRQGDLEQLPLEDSSVDLAVFSQSLHHALHPGQAVAEAYRILAPGGRVVILDLHRHTHEEARDLYADVWLGFAQTELMSFLETAGFGEIDISLVHKEEAAPQFETVLAMATK